MPLTSTALKPPSVQHIQWDGTNLADIEGILGGTPAGWTVTANGSTLHLSGGTQGDMQLPTGTWLVGPKYWGTIPPPFSLSEVLADADYQAKYGV